MKQLSIRGLVMSSLFAALLVMVSFIKVQVTGSAVPITLQTLVVMLAGVFLGPLYGFLSIFLVVLLTALGLPMIGGFGGISVLLGATGGYILTWPLASLLIGLMVRRAQGAGTKAFLLTFAAAELFGSWLVYAGGVPWYAQVKQMSMSAAFVQGCLPFLIPDAVKAAITALIAVPIKQVYSTERLTGGSQAQVAEL
ncbi:biotin transporter BioY [Paenibacillus chartarius]|uniref:Biotin transporter n=1 Tax=Paenibacillus chartarius TaxID=747481 RepID=A0ABV6DFP5_9BACL